MRIPPFLPLTFLLVPATASANLWITNFTSPTAGFWKNSTTATDLPIPISLAYSNATIAEETTTADDFPWIDLSYDLFNPNYDGDYIALKVLGGATASVTISFGTAITDPVLNFTDVDAQTTLVFSTASPTKVGGAPNLKIDGNQVTTTGTSANPFDPADLETAGSLLFSGTFTELAFTIVNTGTNPTQDDDVTGFSVSTTTEPTLSLPIGNLSIWVDASNVHLSWPDTTTFSRIEYTTTLAPASWMTFTAADPTSTTMWSGPVTGMGDTVFFRGAAD